MSDIEREPRHAPLQATAHASWRDSQSGAALHLSCEEALRLAGELAGHPLLMHLPSAVLAGLIAEATPLRFPPGAALLRTGAASDFALLLVSGSVQVTIDTGYDAVELARIGAPALVGEIGPFTGVPRTADVVAVDEVHVLRLPADALLTTAQAHPAFLGAVMRQLGGRFETFNRAFGFYADALNALERRDFDLGLLDDLRNPLPELVNFSHSFRRLAEAIMVREAERRELANAAAIQRAMLPEPEVAEAVRPRADLYAEMRPAKDIGGDFYDYFRLDDRHLAFSLGDVSGKGIPAALFMTATQTALRTVIRHQADGGPPDVAAAAAAVNRLLCATNREQLFVTLFMGVLDLQTGTLDYCNCGHGEGVVLRADGALEPQAPTGMALAVLEEAPYRGARIRLSPGDRLFIYSDGLTDAMNAAEEFYGEARLAAAVAGARPLPAQGFVTTLLDAIADWSGNAPQFDDMTALAVTWCGDT